MADDLINYINEEKAKGTPRETIRSALVSSGWDEKDVDKGLNSVFGLEKPGEPSKATKSKSFLPFIIIGAVIVLAAAGAVIYFTMFYSPCPKLTEPPLTGWNPVALTHSVANEQGIADTINLDAYVDGTGKLVIENRWRTYLESQDLGNYEFLRTSSASQCWTGDIGMDQNPNYNYCVARLKKKESDEQKILWIVFERGEAVQKEVSFDAYSKFAPVQWAFTDIVFVESYCSEEVVVMSASQSEQVNPTKNFFNPGELYKEYEVESSIISVNITNGLGERINLESIKASTCEMNFNGEVINDKSRRLYELKGCNNGLEGETFTGDITLVYFREGSDEQLESKEQISKVIIESEEEEEEDVIVPLPDPCFNTTCVGVAHGYGGMPSLTWTGSEYGVAWIYDMGTKNRLYFARLDAEGIIIGEETRVKERRGTSHKASVVRANESYAILWPVDGKLYFQKIDSEGKVDGQAVDITHSAAVESASIAWTGSGYGVVLGDINSKSYIFTLDANGNKVIEPVEVGMTSSETPEIVWEGGEYGVVWVEKEATGRKIYLARFDLELEKLSTIALINDYLFCDDISLSWANNNYGVAYKCNEDDTLANTNIYFMRVHSTGGAAEMIELDFGIIEMSNTNTFSRNPSLVLSSDNYGMIWEDSRDGNSELYFGWLDTRTGTRREEAIKITTSVAESLDASMVHTGTEYGVVWTENVEGQVDLFFGRFE